MFRQIVNSFKLSPSTKQATSSIKPVSITIYHNPNSLTSHNLLNKLVTYSKSETASTTSTTSTTRNFDAATLTSIPRLRPSVKFNVNVIANQPIAKDHFDYIMSNLDYHPDNHAIMLQLLGNNGLTNSQLLKKFDLHHNLNFENVVKSMKSHQSANGSSIGPLIIDHKHHLLANDFKSFDRMMANYLSCGMQNVDYRSANVNTNVIANGERDRQQQQHEQRQNRDGVVHPHSAEFADLF
ncbi:hypothetical protein PVL30_005331 [Lodderomyces elongisporus]|uniref:uncharacterized protein n=1 Tax=Lodderomyces elongisporus TaxID=36914 RepID=UPI0029201CBA|nr:uncharacterized protein PVL30_005331 [Lodderomyces elongisporus]WLF81533.1 hypothetical protein PVL30_005331 [Lodderomyces elongisporus]